MIKFDYNNDLPDNRLQKEVTMNTGSVHGICSMISLCQPIPKHLQDPSMALWPPSIIPSVQRVRNESPSRFRDAAHRPRSLDGMSDSAFRVRKWVQFANIMQQLGAVRMGEDVVTYSTLLSESCNATKERPWQGIWVGDYSGHGCEFLLVMQREVVSNTTMSRQSSTGSLPPGMSFRHAAIGSLTPGLSREETEAEAEDDRESGFNQVSELQLYNDAAEGGMVRLTETSGETVDESAVGSNVPEAGHSSPTITQTTSNDKSAQSTPSGNWEYGRLEAIKLTGDINVPRGQYTWIAEDIGPKGLIRIGNEQMFAGARMVKSWGRIAGRGFRHDRFIPSQLILISHDTLAQYWEVCLANLRSFCASADITHRTSATFPFTKGLTLMTI